MNDVTKFRMVDPEKPKSRGRPQRHYHHPLQEEKELKSAVHQILPTENAASVCLSGSRLAHLYGLPKTHKKQSAMLPILSATQTYNSTLGKWLEGKTSFWKGKGLLTRKESEWKPSNSLATKKNTMSLISPSA